MSTVRPAPRAFRAVTSAMGEAATDLGDLTPGCRVVGMTKGQYSLLDLLRAVLNQTGPADVTVSTWTTGIRDAEAAAWLLSTGAIRSFRLLTDRSFPGRQPAYCKKLVELFGPEAILCTRTHAKFAVIRNDAWAVVVRSSMNLNTNPRFEQFDLDDDPVLANFFLGLVDDIAERMPPGVDFTTAEADAAFVGALGGGARVKREALSEPDTRPLDQRAGWSFE